MAGERPAFPTDLDVVRALLEQQSLETHVAIPGRIQSYDPATQTADVLPMVRQPVPQPDGTYLHEDLPVLPSVPVIFPRVGRWFVAMGVAPGDAVQLLVNSAAIGAWRTGDGRAADPGDLRRSHLAHAVAIVGLDTRANALRLAPSSGMVLGHDEDGGLRITLKPDGSAQITVGDEVAVQVDADHTVHIGGAAGQFVALANLVNDRLTKLQTAFDAHTHQSASPWPVLTPTPVPGVVPVGTLASVAATKAKAT